MRAKLAAVDHDYTRDKASPAAKEVGHPEKYNTTQPVAEAGFEAVQDAFKDVAERWDAKCQKEGRKVYRCPICKGRKEDFATKAKCSAHIRKEHANRVAVLKHEGAPKDTYEPTMAIINPKRTLADCLPGTMGERAQQMQEAAKASAGLMRQATRGSSTDLTASRLIVMVESLACLKVHKLSDSELTRLAQMATARGRRRLARKAREECARREIELKF